jgi:LuxR family maltose regulon positive regulatory protein
LPGWLYRLRIVQARFKETQGDLDGVLGLLHEAEQVYYRGPLPDFRPIMAMRVRILLRQGRLSDALDWARKSGLSANDELNFLRELEHVTLARVLLAGYQRDQTGHSIPEATKLLERLRKAAEDGGRYGSMIEILVVQALAHGAQGNFPAALASLERALVLGEPEGYVQVFVGEGRPMKALLERLKTEGNQSVLNKGMVKYVDQLLTTFPGEYTEMAKMPPANVQPSALIEPLSERELDVLGLLESELTGPDIARQLGVSLTTVRTHTQNIYKKLGVNNRRAAVRRAAELGLL